MTALVIPDFGQQTGEHYDENQRTLLKSTTLNCVAKHKANER